MSDKTVTKALNADGVGARELGYDFIRVAASLMVVVIHVAGPGFYRFDGDWLAFNFYDSMSRSAVPLFFMISGALLVPRDDDLRSIFRRVLKMVVPLAFGSYFYLLWWAHNRVQPAPDLNPLSLLHGPVVFHFWFFYTLIGVYLFLPLLQGLYRKGRSFHISYLTIVFIGASLIPFIQEFSAFKVGLDLKYFPLYAGYTFAGAVLSNFIPSRNAIFMSSILGIFASLGTAGGTWYISTAGGSSVETLYVYHAPLVVVSSAAFFFALRGIGTRLTGSRFAPSIHFVAHNAIGIFIFHIFFIDLMRHLGFPPEFINPWLGIPVVSVAVWCLSLVLSSCVRLLPYGKLLLP